MTTKQTYTVNCGNIGIVYDGPSKREARKAFRDYVEASKRPWGRASEEGVYTMASIDGIIDEYWPEEKETT